MEGIATGATEMENRMDEMETTITMLQSLKEAVASLNEAVRVHFSLIFCLAFLLVVRRLVSPTFT